jgi:hypothetical protein
MAAMTGGGRMVRRVRLTRQTGGGLRADPVRAGTVIALWILSLMVLAFTVAVLIRCFAWADWARIWHRGGVIARGRIGPSLLSEEKVR